MGKNTTGIFLRVIIIAVLCFIANMILYKLPQFTGLTDLFIYPLWMVYLFFLLFSLLIVFILLKIKQKNEAQLGYAFLFLTTLKLCITYVFARKIIAATGNNPAEKVNFFAIFILFLAIEVYYTARLLNNKQ